MVRLMADPTQPGTELVTDEDRTETLSPASTAVIMSPAQYESTWKMAKALAHSASFKDIGKDDASKALARILLGADLGMSPTQSLMGIDIVKGNPQIRGVALGRMVRQSAKRPTPSGESYDYAVLDRGFRPGEEFAVVALYRRDDDGQWPWIEGEPVTFPTIIGPVTIDTGQRYPEAVEAFRLDQARKRNLIKSDGAWGTQPEVMVVWRALSQLVRFYAPDVIGGVPVYTEADGFPPPVAAGQGDGSMPEWTIDTAQRVKAEAIIERAKALGHHGYSEESVRMALNGQTFSVIEQRLAQMDATLDQFRGQDAEPITDADVVPDAPADEFTLSFGGETFAFRDSDDPYAMIAAALAEGPDAMEATARALRTAGEAHDDEDEGLRYIDMAVALHAEAQERQATE
jgi:hypothetical protein